MYSAATAPASQKTIVLKSIDGKAFEVEESVAIKSETIKHMIEVDCADNNIPLPNVTSEILAKVLEYCKRHVDAAAKTTAKGFVSSAVEDDLKAFDAEFVKVDGHILYDIISAAHYLDIKGLLDLTCRTFADILKGKTPEEIRQIFNIENDFTPEEEEEVLREIGWALQ